MEITLKTFDFLLICQESQLFVPLLFLRNCPFNSLVIYLTTYYLVTDMNYSATGVKLIGKVYSNNSSNVLMRVMIGLTGGS